MEMHKKARELIDNPDFVRRVNELVVRECGETELAVDFLARVTVATALDVDYAAPAPVAVVAADDDV